MQRNSQQLDFIPRFETNEANPFFRGTRGAPHNQVWNKLYKLSVAS